MNTTELTLCLSLFDATARMRKAIEDTLGAMYGLSLADLKLLQALHVTTEGGRPLAQVASELMQSRSTLVRAALPLEKLGWLERDSGCLRLTAVGHRQTKEATIDAGRAAQKVLRMLCPGDQCSLQALLGRIAPLAAQPGPRETVS